MSGKHVIVYGGAGALGAAAVDAFKKASWTVTSIDLRPNASATHDVHVDTSLSFEHQAQAVIEGVRGVTEKAGKADAVFCVAGGWAGGNAGSEDFLKNSELVWVQSGQSSLVAARLAALFLKENGLVTFTGASAAAQGGTPGMIGYGMVKAAVHHLVSSLSKSGGGLPKGAKANAILPVTLDTPMNRKFMADADKSSWTPLDVLAKKLVEWATSTDSVKSGELVEITTANGETKFVGRS